MNSDEPLDNLIRIANSLIIEVRAMQAKEPHWFEGFSVYEEHVDDDLDDTMAIEWPNLSILLDQLTDAVREMVEKIRILQDAQILEMTGKMIEHG